MPPTRSILATTAQQQHAASLGGELDIIIRVAQLMQAGLRAGELSISYADQLGHSALAVLKEAVALSTGTEDAARAA